MIHNQTSNIPGEGSFFLDFLQGYAETLTNRSLLHKEADIKLFLEGSFKEICENWGRFFDEYVNIFFRHPNIVFFKNSVSLANGLRNDRMLSFVPIENNTYINLAKLDQIVATGQTKLGIAFCLAHEISHSIQTQLQFKEKETRYIEYHAHYLAGYMLQKMIDSSDIKLSSEEIRELFTIFEIHGIMHELGCFFEKKELTHRDGKEAKRAIREGFSATEIDIMNTFPPQYSKINTGEIIRPYEERVTNCTFPDN